MEVLTSENFDQKTGSGVVMVDFFADWCGPCKRLAPDFEAVAGEVSDASFYKVNVDQAGDLAMKFGVRSIPTLIVFKDGEVVEKAMGALPKEQLKDMVTKHV